MNNVKETRIEAVAWWLECYLENAIGWVTSAEMQRDMKFTAEEIREARALVGAANVISCGKGYRATRLCTMAELGEAQAMHERNGAAADKNADDINKVRVARLEAMGSEIERREVRLREMMQAAARGDRVDVWAAISGKDAA